MNTANFRSHLKCRETVEILRYEICVWKKGSYIIGVIEKIIEQIKDLLHA